MTSKDFQDNHVSKIAFLLKFSFAFNLWCCEEKENTAVI